MNITKALSIGAVLLLPNLGHTGVVSWSTTTTTTASPSLQFVSGSNVLTATAYSTSTAAALNSVGPTDSSTWVKGQLQGYGTNGFGVKNKCASSNSDTTGCTGLDTSEGVSPEHAVDNEQLIDIVVFKLPTIAGFTWSFNSLSIGWRSYDTTPEVNVWIGGGAGFNEAAFLSTCFVGCSNPNTSLLNEGFKYAGRVDFGAGASASITGADTGAPFSTASAPANANATGQYIVIAASAKGGDREAFKISGLSVNQQSTPPSGGGTVPEPGSLALLAGGLVILGRFFRRPI